jgi:hypothetical protein
MRRTSSIEKVLVMVVFASFQVLRAGYEKAYYRTPPYLVRS